MGFQIQNGQPVYDFDSPTDDKEFSSYLESAYKSFEDKPVEENKDELPKE